MRPFTGIKTASIRWQVGTRKAAALLTALTVGLGLGWGAWGAESPFTPNDRALGKRLEQEAVRLLRGGKVATNLATQLSKSSTLLKLPPPSTRTCPPGELYPSARRGVVVVGELYLCGKCDQIHVGSASGFILSESGAMATCRHVIEHTNTIGLVAMTGDERVWPVRGVLAVNRAADVAIVQLEGSGFTPLPITTNAPVGSPISVLSHPDRHYFMLTTGVISRYYDLGRRNLRSTWMTVTAPFAKGSSGGPVLDAAGNVVGLVNNTESIYYDQTARGQRDLQMVMHNCTPAAELMSLIRPPPAGKAR